MSQGILRWLFQYTMCIHFNSQEERMAAELHIQPSALKLALAKDGVDEAEYILERLMGYFMKRSISIDEILAKYHDRLS